MRTQHIRSKTTPSGLKKEKPAIVCDKKKKNNNILTSSSKSNMRRVSSRQRLVSWDAFEASAMDISIETYYEPSFMVSCGRALVSPNLITDEELNFLSSSRINHRKRNRVERSVTNSHVSGFDNVLCQDVQLHIASFLAISDARSLMMTNKEHHHLVQDATFLWEQWCHQQWPHLPADLEFYDDSSSSCSSPTTSKFASMTAAPNYSQLLELVASNEPTHVDSSTFMLGRTPLFRSVDRSTPNTVQYLGVVGTGDRCIRSNAPLVRPCESTNNKLTKRNLLKFLLHRKHSTPKPFVSPFREGNKVVLTPRLVSYFEITILTEGPEILRRHNPMGTPPPNVSDCVAIGLSTKNFRCFSRMPGWDAFSYGYHGDDGGIFHSSGDMLKRFGPSFGKGDTIGCGVSYRTGGIFFTLNGKFLGYAWEHLDGLAQKDLYPTVGVDSNAPVDCNFGEKEYKFGLSDFLRKDRLEHAKR